MTGQGSMATVLVAEDTDGVRRMLVRALAVTGYHVLAAAGGLEALDLAWQGGEALDLAIIDLQLGGDDGQVLAEALQRLRPGLPILFVTGDLDPDRLMDLLGPVLLKPFGPKALARCVRDYLATGTCTDCAVPVHIKRRAGNE